MHCHQASVWCLTKNSSYFKNLIHLFASISNCSPFFKKHSTYIARWMLGTKVWADSMGIHTNSIMCTIPADSIVGVTVRRMWITLTGHTAIISATIFRLTSVSMIAHFTKLARILDGTIAIFNIVNWLEPAWCDIIFSILHNNISQSTILIRNLW